MAMGWTTAFLYIGHVLTYGVPVPTGPQLQYQQSEIVALTHFNMATFFKDGDPACNPSNWHKSQQPASFMPTNLNVSNWIENYKALGAKSAILTAKHGCGFLLWPTKVTLPDGSNYGYHVGGKGGLGVDVVGEFVKQTKAAGLPHSLYYSLKDSFYLNAIHDKVRDPKTLLPGQVNVTEEQFDEITLAAIKELWSSYGSLNEIWFDGGVAKRVRSRVKGLLDTLQPDTVTFNAGIDVHKHEVAWIGTETGLAKYPIWSTGCTPGTTGTPPDKSTVFCPKGSDCTLQSPDTWFFVPGAPIKSLERLTEMYHHTVGANSVMEMDFAIDRTGNVDPSHAKRYKEFGDWIRACYGESNEVGSSEFADSAEVEIAVKSKTVDRVAIQEDLALGQRVLEYVVEAQTSALQWLPFSSGTSIGHKRIDVLRAPMTDVAKLRVRATSSAAAPRLRLAAFAPEACKLAEEVVLV